jgi:butyrate kinase
MITGKGGIIAYLGTNNFIELYKMADSGDEKAILIREAIAYQIAKEIGAIAAILEGKVDAIILTGGLAYQESHVERIRKMVEFIADVAVFPGEDEIRALAFNGLMALDGKIEIREYS